MRAHPREQPLDLTSEGRDLRTLPEELRKERAAGAGRHGAWYPAAGVADHWLI